MQCILKGCTKCNGDLVVDGDEYRCWQCGNYYYPKIELPELLPVVPVPQPATSQESVPLGTQRRRRRSRWAVRDINALIVAKDRSEARWWCRNETIIEHLDGGKSIREIASIVNRSERQVRVVREQLNDMRAVTQAEAAIAA